MDLLREWGAWLLDRLMELFAKFVDTLWSFFWGKVKFFWDALLELLPDIEFPPFVGEMMPYLEAANHWFPLAEGAVMLGLYVASWLVLIPIRVVVNSLPFIS